MAKHSQRSTDKPEASNNTLLGELLAAKGFSASAPEPTPAQPKKEFDYAKLGKVVLRKERKGRGGKTVTVVSGFTLPPMQLENLARAMRKGLGCGSAVEQGTVVLQGDIADRAEDWLKKQGVVKIIKGT